MQLLQCTASLPWGQWAVQLLQCTASLAGGSGQCNSCNALPHCLGAVDSATPAGVVWCSVVWCGVVWCGVVWCSVVWCGVVWCGVVWCGVVWCGVVWCGVVWCGVVWCGVVWCGVVWCGVVWCAVVWCGVVQLCKGVDTPSVQELAAGSLEVGQTTVSVGSSVQALLESLGYADSLIVAASFIPILNQDDPSAPEPSPLADARNVSRVSPVVSFRIMGRALAADDWVEVKVQVCARARAGACVPAAARARARAHAYERVDGGAGGAATSSCRCQCAAGCAGTRPVVGVLSCRRRSQDASDR